MRHSKYITDTIITHPAVSGTYVAPATQYKSEWLTDEDGNYYYEIPLETSVTPFLRSCNRTSAIECMPLSPYSHIDITEETALKIGVFFRTTDFEAGTNIGLINANLGIKISERETISLTGRTPRTEVTPSKYTSVYKGLYGFIIPVPAGSFTADSIEIIGTTVQAIVFNSTASTYAKPENLSEKMYMVIFKNNYFTIETDKEETIETDNFYIKVGTTDEATETPDFITSEEIRISPEHKDKQTSYGVNDYKPEYSIEVNDIKYNFINILNSNEYNDRFNSKGYGCFIPASSDLQIKLHCGNSVKYGEKGPASFRLLIGCTTKEKYNYYTSDHFEVFFNINAVNLFGNKTLQAISGSGFETNERVHNSKNESLRGCVISVHLDEANCYIDDDEIFITVQIDPGLIDVSEFVLAFLPIKYPYKYVDVWNVDLKLDSETHTEEKIELPYNLEQEYFVLKPTQEELKNNYYAVQFCLGNKRTPRTLACGIKADNLPNLWLSTVDSNIPVYSRNLAEVVTLSRNPLGLYYYIGSMTQGNYPSSGSYAISVEFNNERWWGWVMAWYYDPIEHENSLSYGVIYIPSIFLKHFENPEIIFYCNSGSVFNYDYLLEEPEPIKDSCRIVFQDSTGATKSGDFSKAEISSIGGALYKENAEAGGGCGAFAILNEYIYPVQVPTDYSAEFLNLYSAKSETLTALKNLLWQTEPTIWDTIKGTVNNALNCIVTLHCIPLPPSHSGSTLQAIRLGTQLANSGQCYPLKRYVLFESNSISVGGYYDTSLDYEPYTNISIYLPYSGMHALKASECMGGTVSIKLVCDFLTGDIAYTVICAKNVDEYSMYHFSGNCRSDIPIASSDYSALLTNALKGSIGTVMSIGAGIASGGALPIIGGALNAVSGALQTAHDYYNPDITHSENISGNAGWLTTQVPYLYIERPVAHVAENYGNLAGYDSFITKKLSEVTGYTKVAGIHLDGIPATNEELQEIETLLRNGVIL